MNLVWFPVFLLIIVAGALCVASLVMTLLCGRRTGAFAALVGLLMVGLFVFGFTSMPARQEAIRYMSSAPDYTIEAWPQEGVHYAPSGDVPPGEYRHSHAWRAAPPLPGGTGSPLARSTYAPDSPAAPPVPPSLPAASPAAAAGEPTNETASEPSDETSGEPTADVKADASGGASASTTSSASEQSSGESSTDREEGEGSEPSAALAEATSDAAAAEPEVVVDVQAAAANEPQDAAAEASEAAAAVNDAVQQEATAEDVPAVAEAEASSSAPREVGASSLPATTEPSVPVVNGPHEADLVGAGETAGEPAPAWVRQPPERIDGYWARVIVSDPFEVPYACDEDLERRTKEAIMEFAEWRMRQRDVVPHRVSLRIGYEEVEMVVRKRHYQRRATSLGEMYQGYQLTVMDDAFQARLDRLIDDAMVADRLAATGAVSGVVLGGVALLFGAFRFAARKSPDPLSVA